tara:strand:- start:69 stop:308 length:240 start_codon:yes stop_codon:yes gene_type:complete
MDIFKQTMINIDSDKLTLSQMVSILILIVSKIDINTISGMARSENKTPKGIRESKKYRKEFVGDQLMCIKGLNETGLPF